MILGRPANMWLGAFIALFNVLAIGHVGGFDPNKDFMGAVNIAAASVISLASGRSNNNGGTKILDK